MTIQMKKARGCYQTVLVWGAWIRRLDSWGRGAKREPSNTEIFSNRYQGIFDPLIYVPQTLGLFIKALCFLSQMLSMRNAIRAQYVDKA